MVSLYDGGVYLVNGKEIVPEAEAANVKALTGREADRERQKGHDGLLHYGAAQHIRQHGESEDQIRLHDQPRHHLCWHRADRQGVRYGEVPAPLRSLTNCHNSLCAVGGTINEDDHMFGLSAAKKYGGIYVPPTSP